MTITRAVPATLATLKVGERVVVYRQPGAESENLTVKGIRYFDLMAAIVTYHEDHSAEVLADTVLSVWRPVEI
jgi:hypothetical protein